jgi:hypothetical protein
MLTKLLREDLTVGRCYSPARLFIIVLLFGIHSINLGMSYIP